MAIQINNTAAVKSSSEKLSQNAVKLDSVKQSIEFILGEVKGYWAQEQLDAQTFAEGLEKNISTLDTVIACNKEFATAITNYMDVTEKISSTSVN